MMGIAPENFVQFCGDNNLFSYGANCGVGPSEMIETVVKLKESQSIDTPLIAKGNCGIPSYHEGNIVYNGTPAVMGDYALLAFKAGAKIIGGCCGTTPSHIGAMRGALEQVSISESYSADEHFKKLGMPWKDTDRSKKRIRRSSLRDKIS